MKAKVIEVNKENIKFDNGLVLESEHESYCCEYHWIDFGSINLREFEGLQFNLDDDNFFERIPNYGIALLPVNGLPVRVPGYGENNGYYSSDLTLTLSGEINGKFISKSYNITECQDYDG